MVKYIWNRLLKKCRGVAIKKSSIHRTAKIGAGTQIINSEMGKYSFCGYDCKIINCSIGSFCSIADGVVIGAAAHPIEWVSTSPVFYSGRDSIKKKFVEYEREMEKHTVIGHDVWIGERALIKPGVTIGNGAVIGMGSVVTKDVEPYEIVAGIPAQRIRYRFDEKIRKALIECRWYELENKQLQKCAIQIKEPKKFIEEVKKCE